MALAISAEGIYKTFRSGWRGRRREKEALRGVNLQIEEGEIFGISGPTGQGRRPFSPFSPRSFFPMEAKSPFWAWMASRGAPNQREGQHFEWQCKLPLEPDR